MRSTAGNNYNKQYIIYINDQLPSPGKHSESGKMWYKMVLHSVALENYKIPGKPEKNGWKLIYHRELQIKTPNVCSKISNRNWILAESRKILPLDILISFWFSEDMQ